MGHIRTHAPQHHPIASSARVSRTWKVESYSAGASPPRAEKGTSVILVPNQYKCIGCSPGKHPDTRTMATGSNDDSRDSVHDTCLCIAA